MDFSEVFSETTVLLDFTLQQDGGEAKEVLDEHDSSNVVSRTVQKEFERVKKRRERVVRSILKASGEGSLNDWEPPENIRLTENDRGWLMDLFGEIHSLATEDEIEERLSLEERRMLRGWDTLFETPNRWIDEVWNGDQDARLLGFMRSVIPNNRDDRQIVCDAGCWSGEGGTGNVVSTDETHILGNSEAIRAQIARNRTAGDIHIMRPEEFLDLDPDYS